MLPDVAVKGVPYIPIRRYESLVFLEGIYFDKPR